jgi:hypothetical protein
MPPRKQLTAGCVLLSDAYGSEAGLTPETGVKRMKFRVNRAKSARQAARPAPDYPV